MGLPSGSKLGPYEIQSLVGAGGMGEVYRARDTRLDRIVAIKILPEHLSGSAEARQRFDREARAISSLSHPNICHLYDVGEQDSIIYLVMEYLEGETLAERLRKGPMLLDQALKVGSEICEGLDKAHRSGVVHRDLKPGNIMLTKGSAKLMDFGLAKAPLGALQSLSSSDSLATRSQPLTTEGTIVGTIQYMSPEQLEGKEADMRSDIFSLGAVLYEMTAGRRAFEGKTTASTIAAILASEPQPITATHPASPASLDRLVRTCLAKDPDERLQSAHDVKVQLGWISQGGSSPGGIAATPVHTAASRLAWYLVGLLSLIIVAGGIGWWSAARRLTRPMYFSPPLPLIANDVALTPDGRTVAIVAYSERANKYVIWRYEIGGREAFVLPGTEDAAHPFWSPDGRSIGFFANGKLKKVDAFSGMSPQVLCDAANGRGGTWNRDGVILFTPDAFKGIHRISSAGGTPVEITKFDASRTETSHRWPMFLPDQQHYLFLGANFSGEYDKNAVFVGSLDSKEKHLVVATSANAAYADPGYLLYIRNNALVAQRFNTNTYTLSGEPRTISDQVQYTPTTDLAVFAVAGNETLVLQNGRGIGTSQFSWFDRSGKALGAAGPPGLVGNGSLSPDGRRIVFDQMEPDSRHWDVWIRDLASDATTRLTFGPGLNQLPIWSPDGKQVIFAAIRKGQWGVHIKNADGSGSERQIGDTTPYTQGSWDWSHDGKVLIFRNGELWQQSSPDSPPKPIFQESWIVRNAQLSPNGKWLAYAANDNDAGNWEVYVCPFPATGTKWQISRGGGREPRWRRDGKELFYISADGKMIAVPVKTVNTFEAGSPLTLFQTHTRQPISALDLVFYDVSADGERFLIDTKVVEPNATPLSITLNWASELGK
jgi:Tol biopolymer transport system component